MKMRKFKKRSKYVAAVLALAGGVCLFAGCGGEYEPQYPEQQPGQPTQPAQPVAPGQPSEGI